MKNIQFIRSQNLCNKQGSAHSHDRNIQLNQTLILQNIF